jgi:tetratricopeptide (TPR) repeat protein
MLAVAGVGTLVLTRIVPRPATATPTPAAISSPAPLPTATPTPVPIVAKAGEKLIVVAPFVGYTSDALRFNVAGRIQEALSDEIARAKLPDTRLALWPAPLVGLEEATQARADSNAALVIWGEYDAGRVRAIVTMPGDQGSSWVNPVASPADLPLVINEEVPQSARIFALYALGQLYRKEQDAASALKLFESALKLEPKDPQTKAALHFYVGTLLPDVRGRTPSVISEAISHFDAALALRPTWSNLRYNRGTAYLGRALLSPTEGADLDEAIADLGQVIAAQPWQEDPYLNRGIAYYQRNRPGDLALAMADFGRALEIAPEDDRGYYHRALAAIRAGQEDVWHADLTRGQAISPGYAPILNAWCWAYATTARPAEALPYCEAAVDADPTGTSLDSRAIAYAQLGRHADAAADFTAYLAWVRQTYPALYEKYRGPAIEGWIAELEAGRNPFAPEVLEMLRQG